MWMWSSLVKLSQARAGLWTSPKLLSKFIARSLSRLQVKCAHVLSRNHARASMFLPGEAHLHYGLHRQCYSNASHDVRLDCK